MNITENIFCSKSVTNETTQIGTAKELNELKFNLHSINDSYDKLIEEVTNHEVYHYIENLSNTSMSMPLFC